MKRYKESNSSSLMQACIDNDIVEVEKLLTSGVNVNKCRDNRGRSPLQMATYRGNINMLSLLLEHGGDLWSKDDIGNILMHLCNHVEVIKFLAKRGLSPIERNINGDTPLMLAIRFGASKEVVALLKQLEQDEMGDEPPVYCPLFSSRNSSWTNELFADLGVYRVLFLILFIAMVSLYITYCIIGEVPFNSPILNDIEWHRSVNR